MQVTVDLDLKQLTNVIQKLEVSDKIKLLKKLENDTFDYRMKYLRNSIPENDITEDDIINEVKSVRKR
ncbi:MAG: hypothetical protein KA885_03580 [Spirochaetes bacterium]|nr:hypothetical protein [Spirochaetota bacterium]